MDFFWSSVFSVYEISTIIHTVGVTFRIKQRKTCNEIIVIHMSNQLFQLCTLFSNIAMKEYSVYDIKKLR